MWASEPFELIVHAEGHRSNGEEFDKRMALISFDNAIEVAISTFLNFRPIHPMNRCYKNSEIGSWLSNFHSKLDFLEIEVSKRGS